MKDPTKRSLVWAGEALEENFSFAFPMTGRCEAYCDQAQAYAAIAPAEHLAEFIQMDFFSHMQPAFTGNGSSYRSKWEIKNRIHRKYCEICDMAFRGEIHKILPLFKF